MSGPYHWTKWSSWSHCNGTCKVNGGVGQQYRTRHCSDGDDNVVLRHCREPYTGDSGDEVTAFIGNTDIDTSIIMEDGSPQDMNEYDYQPCTHPNCPGK